MTSSNSDDGTEFDCDVCGANWRPPRLGIGSDKPSFLECWQDAKDAGWRAVKVRSKTGKDEWEHQCPECR